MSPVPNIIAADDFRRIGVNTGFGTPNRYSHGGSNINLDLSQFGSSPVTTIGVSLRWDMQFGTFGMGQVNLFNFFDSDLSTCHVSVNVLVDGSLRVYRGAQVATLGTSSAGVWGPVDGMQHLDAVLTLHDSTGTFKLKFNGTEVLNLSGLDTINGANGVVGRVHVPGNSRQAMDLIVTDGGDYLGTGKGTIYVNPSAAGANFDVSAVGGSTLISVMGENVPDDDTSYGLFSATSLPRKADGVLSLPLVSAIYAVIPRTKARKTDTGVAALRTYVGASTTSAVEVDNGSDLNVNTTYAVYTPQVLQFDPSTASSTPFTPGQLIRVGVKRTQ